MSRLGRSELDLVIISKMLYGITKNKFEQFIRYVHHIYYLISKKKNYSIFIILSGKGSGFKEWRIKILGKLYVLIN